ncbi:MAG TPA: cyanophycinase [Longimicrobiaceae bacterium]|nr:cyanophycinase [Longimicrobiaceae bacterium]
MHLCLPAVATLALAAACGPVAPASVPAPAPRGHLLVVGGGTQPPELVAHFVELAGGAGRARIAVVPMASGDAEEAGREKAEQLRGLGADAFSLNLTRAQAQGDSAVRLLDGATGIWFSGGDQSRLTAVLQGTPVLTAIHARYRAGAVVGGTSAGAAVLSDSMLTGSQFRPGADTAGYYGDEYPRVARRAIQVVPGFGFLPGAIVDQHFLRRERHNRLLSVVLERPALVGVGIDESTALRVDPDGRWTVVGASAVLVYDARPARVTPPGAVVLGAAGVRMHLLPAGSTFDPRTGRATLP